MTKKIKAVISVMAAIILVLSGLLVYTQIDKAHYKRYKNIISQEEVENTLFNQPISTERDGEYRIGIKTAIHEQNAFPGVTTKMLASKVDAVMLAMPEAQKYMKLKRKPYITGNPVRRELLSASREASRASLNIDERPLILSFGGSLGAKYINLAVAGLIKWHNGSGKFYHIHGTGKSGYESMMNAFNEEGITLSKEIDVREYIKNMDLFTASPTVLLMSE